MPPTLAAINGRYRSKPPALPRGESSLPPGLRDVVGHGGIEAQPRRGYLHPIVGDPALGGQWVILQCREHRVPSAVCELHPDGGREGAHLYREFTQGRPNAFPIGDTRECATHTRLHTPAFTQGRPNASPIGDTRERATHTRVHTPTLTLFLNSFRASGMKEVGVLLVT